MIQFVINVALCHSFVLAAGPFHQYEFLTEN